MTENTYIALNCLSIENFATKWPFKFLNDYVDAEIEHSSEQSTKRKEREREKMSTGNMEVVYGGLPFHTLRMLNLFDKDELTKNEETMPETLSSNYIVKSFMGSIYNALNALLIID